MLVADTPAGGNDDIGSYGSTQFFNGTVQLQVFKKFMFPRIKGSEMFPKTIDDSRFRYWDVWQIALQYG